MWFAEKIKFVKRVTRKGIVRKTRIPTTIPGVYEKTTVRIPTESYEEETTSL